MSGCRAKRVLSPQAFVVSPTVENSHRSESNQDNIRLAPLTRKGAQRSQRKINSQSEEGQKLLDGHSGGADQCSQCPSGQFFVLRTERFARTSGLLKTTWLPTCPMTCQPALEKALTASLPEILARRAMRAEETSDGNDDGGAVRSKRFHRLLILRPQPSCDGFLDVFQGFLLVSPLRDTARQGGTRATIQPSTDVSSET
jgi:hypothetical protein